MIVGNHRTSACSSTAAATWMRSAAAAMSTARTLASCSAVGRLIGSGRSSGCGSRDGREDGVPGEVGEVEGSAARAVGGGVTLMFAECVRGAAPGNGQYSRPGEGCMASVPDSRNTSRSSLNPRPRIRPGWTGKMGRLSQRQGSSPVVCVSVGRRGVITRGKVNCDLP